MRLWRVDFCVCFCMFVNFFFLIFDFLVWKWDIFFLIFVCICLFLCFSEWGEKQIRVHVFVCVFFLRLRVHVDPNWAFRNLGWCFCVCVHLPFYLQWQWIACFFCLFHSIFPNVSQFDRSPGHTSKATTIFFYLYDTWVYLKWISFFFLVFGLRANITDRRHETEEQFTFCLASIHKAYDRSSSSQWSTVQFVYTSACIYWFAFWNLIELKMRSIMWVITNIFSTIGREIFFKEERWYTKPLEFFFFNFFLKMYVYQTHLIFTWVVLLNCLAMIVRSFALSLECFPLGDHYDKIPPEILDFQPFPLAKLVHF